MAEPQDIPPACGTSASTKLYFENQARLMIVKQAITVVFVRHFIPLSED